MSNGNYCINRVQKLQTHGRGAKTLSQSLRHLDKHECAADIAHPELSHLNRSLLNDAPTFSRIAKRLDKARAEYDAQIDEYNATKPADKPKKRHMQTRASQAFEGVLTFSPQMTGKIDIDNWVRVNMDFLDKEFRSKGCVPLRLELHMDEETPHIQFIFATIGKNGLFMAKDVLGGRGDLSALQDRYAEAMEQFDLQRGHSRYNEYLNLCRRAIAHGYGNKDGTITYEQVKQYAKDTGVKIPPFRKHTSTREWKAQVEAELALKLDKIKSAEKRLDTLKGLIREQGELIPETQLAIVSKCTEYEDLLKLAGRTIIKNEGKEMSLLKYLTDLKRQQERGHSHELDEPDGPGGH